MFPDRHAAAPPPPRPVDSQARRCARYAAVTLTIRPATAADHDEVWRIFHAVVAPGDTYAFDPATSREAALAYWFQAATHTFVAERHGGRVVGTYILKANQPGLGSHVPNAAFMVDPSARRLGLGRRMGEHCLAVARRLGFHSMQFNFVVSTNEPAVRLWQQRGFAFV